MRVTFMTRFKHPFPVILSAIFSSFVIMILVSWDTAMMIMEESFLFHCSMKKLLKMLTPSFGTSNETTSYFIFVLLLHSQALFLIVEQFLILFSVEVTSGKTVVNIGFCVMDRRSIMHRKNYFLKKSEDSSELGVSQNFVQNTQLKRKCKTSSLRRFKAHFFLSSGWKCSWIKSWPQNTFMIK